MASTPTFADVVDAARRIESRVVRTPVVRSRILDDAVGSEVWLKCENLQEAGAFKFRGATNAVQCLSAAQAAAGVAAHSSGNHAAALALAASRRGIPATLVMPENAPAVKIDAVARAGGRIVLCEPTLSAREEMLDQVLADTGATQVHPYDDPRVIAGAGTAALELMTDVVDLDVVVAPVSGGGLLSGTSLAAHGVRPTTAVVGAEPRRVDDAHRSLVTGVRQGDTGAGSIADGLLAVLSDRTFSILRDHVDEIVLVDEEEIVAAMHFVLDHVKLVVEPSAAVAVAALLARPGRWPRRVGLILSGGRPTAIQAPNGGPTSQVTSHSLP
jgi:threonine dehydratase